MRSCLILPYWGEFPEYFDLWLKSCEYNKSIEWVIITDNEVKSDAANIKVINLSFSNVVNLIRNKLNQDVNIISPYKLCDFKPAYGYIFEDYLRDYNFWGYCDCDMLFGDIKSFITDDIFLENDMIQLWGHMTFIRNNSRCNEMFKLKHNSIDFNQIISWPIVGGFDEFGLPSLMKKENMRVYCNGNILADILPFKHRLLMHQGHNNFPQVFSWENGKVFKYHEVNGEVIREEYMYIHLQKRSISYKVNYVNEENGVFITQKGIIEKKALVPSVELLVKFDTKSLLYNLYFGILRKINTFKKLRKLIISGYLYQFFSFRKEAKKNMPYIH